MRAQIPVNLQRISPELRRPIMIGNHRDTGRHLQHFVHARHRQRFGAFEGFDAGTKHRRARDHRRHQTFELHIHAELGAAGDFLRRVEALGGFADDFPVLGFLEGDRFRIRHGELPGGVRQLAVSCTLIAGNHHARLSANRRGRHFKTLRRCFNQHLPSGRACQPIAIKLHPCRR